MRYDTLPFNPPIPTAALRWSRALDVLIKESCRFEKMMRAKAGYRPEQPRDDRGRWAETGAESRLSATSTWADTKTLDKHVENHGKDFGVTNSEEYAKQANDFYKRGKAEKLPTVVDKSGNIRMYDPKTNTFGSYNPDGTTRTFYKPKEADYFEGQIRRYGPTGRVLNIPKPSGGTGGGLGGGGGGIGGGSLGPGGIPGRTRIIIPGFDV
ncbi:MAG: hypothetical protein V4735_07975 [Pseudomonadota bacterium]